MFPTLSPLICLAVLCAPVDETPRALLALPAIVSVYDPARGGINCDADCAHFATGIPVTPEWYGRAVACDARLLGATVTFPGIGSFECVDRGTLIGERWSYHFDRWVITFDVMVDLSAAVPDWSYTLNTNWSYQW